MSLTEIWGNSYNTASGSGSKDVATDSNNNVYITGDFKSDLSFGSDFLIIGNNNKNMFVGKVDKDGKEEWARYYGTNLVGDTRGNVISTDTSDNLYVSGSFSGDLSFGTHSVYKIIGSTYSTHKFIGKLDKDGDEKWANSYDSMNTGSMVTDSTDNIYFCASSNVNNMSFGHLSITKKSTFASSYGILGKLDTDGNEQWVESYDVIFTGMTIDNDNIYVIGKMPAYDISFGDIHVPYYTDKGSFIGKLDKDGNEKWATTFGGQLWGITTDNVGNIYFNGELYEDTTFGSANLTASTNGDVFLGKLDKDGNEKWAKNYVTTNGYAYGTKIATDNVGNIYASGGFQGGMNFGPDTFTSQNDGMFLLKLDTDGNELLGKSYGGTNQGDMVNSMAIDSASNIYLTGQIKSDIIFGPDNLTTNSNGSIFIMKFGSGTSGTVTSPSSGTVTSQICFLAGTPVLTDQGEIPIEKINSSIHSIYRRPIRAITQTITTDPCLVCFESNSLGMNIPSEKTIMSLDHKILYNNQLISARNFINKNEGIYTVPYKKEILYNVLMDDYERIKVNNLICETLHPKNKVAKLYKRLANGSIENYESIIKEFNNLNQSKRNRFKLKF
jgi:hypothetical protein